MQLTTQFWLLYNQFLEAIKSLLEHVSNYEAREDYYYHVLNISLSG